MATQKQLISLLQARIAQHADVKVRAWWENYVKHGTAFRGVGIPVIRRELKEWYREEHIGDLPSSRQLAIALALFSCRYAEDKIAGILFLQIYMRDAFDWRVLLPAFEKLFQKRYIYDWNVCDWFCVRVLGPLIQKHGAQCARAIARWSTAENVWQARCSLAAFATIAKEGTFTPLLLRSAARLIKRDERFAKTAVGWILREMSKADKQAVEMFIKKYAKYFSKESLENAIAYFGKQKKGDLRLVWSSRL